MSKLPQNEWGMSFLDEVENANKQEIEELEDWRGQLQLCLSNVEVGTFEWNEYVKQIREVDQQIAELRPRKRVFEGVYNFGGSISGGSWGALFEFRFDEGKNWDSKWYKDIQWEIKDTFHEEPKKKFQSPILESISKEFPITPVTHVEQRKMTGFRTIEYVIPPKGKEEIFQAGSAAIRRISMKEGTLITDVYFAYAAETDTLYIEILKRLDKSIPQFR